MVITSIATAAGELRLTAGENARWQGKLVSEHITDGVEEITMSLCADTAELPAEVKLQIDIPQRDVCCRWSTVGPQPITPNWSKISDLSSNLMFHAPAVALIGKDSGNRLTLACSEASRTVIFHTGLREDDSCIECFFKFFTVPEAPLKEYSAKLRIDIRPLFYADAVREAFDWFAAFDAYKPAEVPPAARELLYSSWYSYHKEGLYADTVEKQIIEAKKYGMKTLIVDDGWQCDKYDHGLYFYCGDWQPVPRRFPDMAAHVRRVHEAGFKYILWFSVPFVGSGAEVFKHFEGKYLGYLPAKDTYVLDPRFPEVREYLIATYEKAITQWDLDGFKLDFIDSFSFFPDDPAAAENYAGRDCKTVPEGVDKLMTAVMERLKKIKSDVLIEFRQRYQGPGIRKFGNIIRVGDCPSDAWNNRCRAANLRLSSGKTAVHSDMLSWNYGESAESAARQLLAILFSVPQISVRLEEISDDHQRMLKFWCRYWLENRDILLDGYFKPCAPEHGYPLLTAEKDGTIIAAVYNSGTVADLRDSKAAAFHIINSTDAGEVVVDLPAPAAGMTRDVFGETTAEVALPAGVSRVKVPVSGILILKSC